jgi:hypothetical protein
VEDDVSRVGDGEVLGVHVLAEPLGQVAGEARLARVVWTKVTVPVVVTVTWKVPSSRSVVWRTPKHMIVSIPGAPEQGFASAREMVSLKCMVSVSVAKAALGASSAADSQR